MNNDPLRAPERIHLPEPLRIKPVRDEPTARKREPQTRRRPPEEIEEQDGEPDEEHQVDVIV